MTQSALVLGSEEFRNEPLHKIRYGIAICAHSISELQWNSHASDDSSGDSMSNTDASWQAVLRKIIQQPGERQRLIVALDINPMTLDRWLKNAYVPNRSNFSALVRNVPPEYRQELSEAIQAIHPDFDEWESEVQVEHISTAFYVEILDIRTGIMEAKRNREIIERILNQALLQLDPHRQGMAITLAQCIPPRADGKVHSLRERGGRATPPWTTDLENLSIFLGMESLAGYVVQNQYPLSIEDLSKEQLLPAIQDHYEMSAAAVPILYEGNIAGCLLASSTVIGHFIQQRLAMMGEFADLLTVGMEPSNFYPPSTIQLGVARCRTAAEQREVLRTFRERVQQKIRISPGHAPIKYPEAEELVWREFEEELIIG
jgi:hypothetical protein